MSDLTLGSIYSLLTALSWAIAVILFKRCGSSMPPLALNTFKNTVGLALLTFSFLWVEVETRQTSDADLWVLVLSGAIGIGVADTLLFMGLNLIGASRQAIIDCLYSPAVVVCSYFALGERLSPMDAAGAGLILAGVMLTIQRQTGSQGQSDISRADLWKGGLYSASSVLLMALAIVWAKPALERADVLWSTTLRMLGGLGVLLLLAGCSRSLRRDVREAFVPQKAWRDALPGSVVGTYLALLFWIAGFKYAPASIAAILNQTSTVFIVLLAAAFLSERLHIRVVIAVLAAFVGSIVVLM